MSGGIRIGARLMRRQRPQDIFSVRLPNRISTHTLASSIFFNLSEFNSQQFAIEVGRRGEVDRPQFSARSFTNITSIPPFRSHQRPIYSPNSPFSQDFLSNQRWLSQEKPFTSRFSTQFSTDSSLSSKVQQATTSHLLSPPKIDIHPIPYKVTYLSHPFSTKKDSTEEPSKKKSNPVSYLVAMMASLLIGAGFFHKKKEALCEEKTLLEEDYLVLLEELTPNEDRIKECLYLEKLGNLYQNKETMEGDVQAAGFYNYIHRVSKDPEVIDRMRTNLIELEKSLLDKCGIDKQVPDTFEKNRQKIKDIREKIRPQVLALPDDPSPEKVHAIHKEIALEMKGFLKELIDQCTQIMGTPPCEFAVIGLGSLAREEMTPYSDFEFAILLEKETDKTKEYFTQLTYLLHLKIVNLGETILPTLIPNLRGRFYDSKTPRGLAFDGKGTDGKGSKTPLGNGKTFTLLHTPEKMAELVGQDKKDGRWWFEKEPHLPMEMLNFTHVIGDSSLTEKYQGFVNYQLSLPAQGKASLREYLARYHLFLEDQSNFKPSLGAPDKYGQFFHAKTDFYRLPHLAIDRLALIHCLEEKNSLSRIRKLLSKNILTESVANDLIWVLSCATHFRTQTYCKKEAQKEEVNPLLNSFSISINSDIPPLTQEQKSLIQQMYLILFNLHSSLKSILSGEIQGPEILGLRSNNPLTSARISMRFMDYATASNFYSRIESDAPDVINEKGLVHYCLGEYEKAIQYYENLLPSINSWPEHQKNIVYSNLGISYYSLGYPDKAIKIFDSLRANGDPENIMHLGNAYSDLEMYEDAIRCFHTALDKGKQNNILTKASILTNLGLSYHSIGEYDDSIDCELKALRILKYWFPAHSRIAFIYYNLGLAYESKGLFEKSLSYHEKSLSMRKSLYKNQNHPEIIHSLCALGTLYWLTNQYHLAKSCCKEAYEKCDENISTQDKVNVINHYIIVLNHFLDDGKLQWKLMNEAQELVKRTFISPHPQLIDSLLIFARFLRNKGYNERAKKELKKALKLRYSLSDRLTLTRKANLYLELALTHQKFFKESKNIEKAEGYFTQALEISQRTSQKEKTPQVVNILIHWGKFLIELEEWNLALDKLNQALAISKKMEQLGNVTLNRIYSNIAKAHAGLKNLEKAHDFFLEALSLCPLDEKDPTGHSIHDEFINFLHKENIIFEQFRNMPGTAHNWGCFYHLLAVISHNSGKVKRAKNYLSLAEKMFQMGIKIAPHSGIYCDFAIFCLYKGDKEKALTYLKEATERRSDFQFLFYDRIELEHGNLCKVLQEIVQESGYVNVLASELAYYLLIKELASNGQLAEAEELFKEFSEFMENPYRDTSLNLIGSLQELGPD